VREVLDVIAELADTGMTMVVVTHDLEFARRGGRPHDDGQGAVIEEADPGTFFSAPDHERTRQFLDHVE
jgi:ABC-type polar amino acid transport system ATPase subunit